LNQVATKYHALNGRGLYGEIVYWQRGDRVANWCDRKPEFGGTETGVLAVGGGRTGGNRSRCKSISVKREEGVVKKTGKGWLKNEVMHLQFIGGGGRRAAVFSNVKSG